MNEGSTAFYATTATVLPLFVLTLASGRRLGLAEGSETPAADAGIGILMLCAMAIGELAAFSALASKPTRGTLHASELGIGLAGLLLFGDLVWSQVRAHATYDRPKWEHRLVKWAAGIVIAVGIVLLGLTWLGDFL